MLRRKFIKKSSLGLVLPFIVPSYVLNSDAPSNKINVGVIGVGEHGTNWNLKRYLELKDMCRVVVVCDVDDEHLERAKNMVNKAYSNNDCQTTKDFREIISREDIDAVMISTPDHWHTIMSVMAMRAGKDVQCEKPTLTINEGKLLIEVANKTDRIFQTSTEDRSIPVYHRMAELVRNGRIGQLKEIFVTLPKMPNGPGDPTPQKIPLGLDYDMWLGPAPWAPYTKDRVHFNFRWISDYSNGIIADWGAHLFDTAQWANNTELSGPIEIEGTGSFWNEGLYNTIKDYDITYKYSNGVIMRCEAGTEELTGAIKFIGSDGWIGNRKWLGELEGSSEKILNSVIGVEETNLYTNPKGEHHDFLQCVKSRNRPYFPVDIGHRVSTICHLGTMAVDLGRKLEWDPINEVFSNDLEANKHSMVKREYRSPWILE